jgi:hypothetical protein
MPATASSALGLSQKRAASGAIAARASGTTTCGTRTSSVRSTTSATAPPATASAARSWPSARSPRTQKKSAPGATWRVS